MSQDEDERLMVVHRGLCDATADRVELNRLSPGPISPAQPPLTSDLIELHASRTELVLRCFKVRSDIF